MTIDERVAQAKSLIGSADPEDHRELGWLIHKLAQIVERDPSVTINDPAIEYKVRRMLSE